MKTMLNSLSNRDLTAYLTKLMWPRKLTEEPLQCSESFLNPHLVPNKCVGDTDLQTELKQQKVQQYEFLIQFLQKRKAEQADRVQKKESDKA